MCSQQQVLSSGPALDRWYLCMAPHQGRSHPSMFVPAFVVACCTLRVALISTSFIISFCIGILLVYLLTPIPKIIIRYPTPENAGKIIYKDDIYERGLDEQLGLEFRLLIICASHHYINGGGRVLPVKLILSARRRQRANATANNSANKTAAG